MRSCNPVTECAILLRESLQKLDFGLTDKFGDAQDLTSSWTKSKIPDVLIQFFSILFYIDPNSIEEADIIEGEEDEDLKQTKHSQKWYLKAQALSQIICTTTYIVELKELHCI